MTQEQAHKVEAALAEFIAGPQQQQPAAELQSASTESDNAYRALRKEMMQPAPVVDKRYGKH